MPIPTRTEGRRSGHARTTFRAAIALGLAVATLGLVGCGDESDDAASDAGSGDDTATTQITIAHQAFGESEIVAHIYGEVLAANGFEVEYQSFKDRAAIYTAFESGDVDLLPEYAASGLEYLNKNAGEASPDIDETQAKLVERLAEVDLASGAPSAAVDTNSLVVTGDTASSKSLSRISDLTADLKLGGPQDCPTNAGCIPALKDTYGLDFTSTFTPLDLGGPLTKAALEEGDIDVAIIFSTDSSIAANGWKVLDDDKGIFNADNIVPVGVASIVNDNVELLDKVSAALTTENVTELNKRYDVDKEDAADIAKDFVKSEGL